MLCQWLYHLTSIDLFDGRLFRAGTAAMLSIILVMCLMPVYIRKLQSLDATSDFDKDGKSKSPPIMGGLLLVIVVEIVSLLVCKMNGYTISTLIVLAAFSAVGAIDDIAKVKAKRLIKLGKLKAADYMDKADGISSSLRLFLYFLFSLVVAIFCYKFIPELKGDLTIPFCPISVFQIHLPNWIFVGFMTFVIAASANGTNFTDGLDSLVSVPILSSMIFVGLVAYVSGNFIFSQYLSVPYLPVVQAGLFLPIVCIIIIAEACSVLLQISWFKFTKKTTGEGKRIFLCAPLHHHYQKKWEGRFPSKPLMNSKIVWRMHLISIFALIVSMVIFFGIR